MSDLKTNFDKAVYPNTSDLGGTVPTDRGTDPNVNLSGSGAIQTNFDKAINPSEEGQESANSVSGLPSLPSRFAPSETPPEMPSLQDRMPGTIDKQ